jgi:hypothetical protein
MFHNILFFILNLSIMADESVLSGNRMASLDLNASNKSIKSSLESGVNGKSPQQQQHQSNKLRRFHIFATSSYDNLTLSSSASYRNQSSKKSRQSRIELHQVYDVLSKVFKDERMETDIDNSPDEDGDVDSELPENIFDGRDINLNIGIFHFLTSIGKDA